MKRLLLLLPLCLVACYPPLDPEKIARVEQNFDKVKPGMSMEQVKELVGEPSKKIIVESNTEAWNIQLCGRSEKPCRVDLWLLASDPEDSLERPHVSFDPSTGTVLRAFRESIDRYFD